MKISFFSQKMQHQIQQLRNLLGAKMMVSKCWLVNLSVCLSVSVSVSARRQLMYIFYFSDC